MSLTQLEKEIIDIFENNGVENIHIIHQDKISDQERFFIDFKEDVIINTECLKELALFLEKNNILIKSRNANNFSFFFDDTKKLVDKQMENLLLLHLTPFKADNFSIIGSRSNNLYYPPNCNSVSIEQYSYNNKLKLSPVFGFGYESYNISKNIHVNHFISTATEYDDSSIFPGNCETFNLTSYSRSILDLEFENIKELIMSNIETNNLIIKTPLKLLNLFNCYLNNSVFPNIQNSILLGTQSDSPLELTVTDSIRTNNIDNNICYQGKVKEFHLMMNSSTRYKNESPLKNIEKVNDKLVIDKLTYFEQRKNISSPENVMEKLTNNFNASKISFLEQLKEIKKVIVVPAPDGIFKRKLNV